MRERVKGDGIINLIRVRSDYVLLFIFYLGSTGSVVRSAGFYTLVRVGFSRLDGSVGR